MAPRFATLPLPNEVGPLALEPYRARALRRLGFVRSHHTGEAMQRGKFIRKEVRDSILFVLVTVLVALFSVAVVIEVAEPLVA